MSFSVDKGATFVFDTCVNNLDIVSQKAIKCFTRILTVIVK